MNLKYLFSLFAFLCCLAACSDKETDPVIGYNNPPVLTSPTAGSTIVLDETTPDMTVPTEVAWTAANFGFDAAINYAVQIDFAGADFANAKTFGATAGPLTLGEYTMALFNNNLLSSGIPGGVQSEVEMRVCASVSDYAQQQCSESVTLTVAPYLAEIDYPLLNVPGDYQSWDPGNNNTAIYSRNNDEIYRGFVYFQEDTVEYKFAKGSWDMNWGDNDQDGTLDDGGDNIKYGELGSGPLGMHYLVADLSLDMGSHTYTPVAWYATGSAIGTDTDFEWDDARQILTLTTDLSAGSLRFKTNPGNQFDFGDEFGNGLLSQGGNDIEITESGNYTIDLYVNVGTFKYELTKN